MLKCSACGRRVENLQEGRARCPYCGVRILLKIRPETVRKVKAI